MAEPTGAERLIVALDVDRREAASRLLRELDGRVSFFKIGQEMLAIWGPDFLEELTARGQVFVDLKLGDIDETARRTVRAWSGREGVRFLTIQNTATARNIQAAVEGRGSSRVPELLFVSYLSSQDREDFAETLGLPADGFHDYIRRRCDMALRSGCDGLIASGPEIARLRSWFPETTIVSPGIRPAGSPLDDHKRSATPAEAIRLGADYLVVGRPIRNAPDPARAAEEILREMDAAFRSRPGGRPSPGGAPRALDGPGGHP